MLLQPKRLLLQLLVFSASGLGVIAVSAAPVTHYSEVNINSFEAVNDANPDRLVDFAGGSVQLSASGSRSLGFRVPGGTLVNRETSSVFARSSLSTGELKAATSLGLGSITFGTAPAPGLRYATASATAAFADQFRLYSGSTPFLWASDTEVSFSLGITGVTNIPVTVPVPPSSDGLTWASLRLNVYKVGTLDLIDQFSKIDLFPNGVLDQEALAIFLGLNDQISANSLYRTGWCLGDSRTPSDFCGGSFYQNVALINGEALIDAAFAPGEDFEWILDLETQVRLDLSLQNTSVTLDFANTVDVGFDAPEGTTVYSGSGQFPGTLSVADLPNDNDNEVPEPTTLILCALALLILGTQRRRLEVLQRVAPVRHACS